MTEEEVDYYEVQFATDQDLDAARKHILIHAELGTGAGLVKADHMDKEEIEAALEPLRLAGIEFTVEASSMTQADMWPTWPEDEDEDEADVDMAP